MIPKMILRKKHQSSVDLSYLVNFILINQSVGDKISDKKYNTSFFPLLPTEARSMTMLLLPEHLAH